MSAKGKKYSSDDDDDVFYYRYSSTATAPPPSTTSNKTSGSSKLAPSKSTVYISNVDYSLTNSDLFTIFSTFGKLAKVTVLKDRATRLSKGVAFVLFVSREDAIKATKAMDGKILNGRTLRASIAADNGRASEFIRKKVYKDKSRCYECGEEGHLSYECPKNSLGARERPVQKKVCKGEIGEIRGGNHDYNREKSVDVDDGDGDKVFEIDNWASVVDGGGAEERLLRGGEEKVVEKKRGKRKGYFSDESDDED